MRLHVDNMTCGGCARSVTKTIQSVDPAARVAVDLDAKTVDLGSERPLADFAAALSAAGYPAKAA